MKIETLKQIMIEVTTDDRPCDTEAPDNVVRVNFK